MILSVELLDEVLMHAVVSFNRSITPRHRRITPRSVTAFKQSQRACAHATKERKFLYLA